MNSGIMAPFSGPTSGKTALDNPIWAITGVQYANTKEQESGQLLIDKERCWAALNRVYTLTRTAGCIIKYCWATKIPFALPGWH